jgi:hypothetical protein
MAAFGYCNGMKSHSVANCTLIIRSQVEYSTATQTVVLRCILEKSVSDQRRGFTDVDALLAAVRAELAELQSQIIPSDAQNKNSACNSSTPAPSDSVRLMNADRSDETGTVPK